MLYSVRRSCARDFQATLREVAEIGYSGVELFDLHGESAAKVGGWAASLGLEVCGRHVPLETIENDLATLADEAEALGCRRLVVSWLPPDSLNDESLSRLAAAAGAVRARGLELGFHNHDAEIRQGFIDRLPPDVFLELDAGWAWWAGADPVELLGRGPLVHVKDFRERGRHSFCPVGDGAVDYERVLPAAYRAGVEWLIVEQDEAESELDDARRSFAAVTRILRSDG
jgi:sugar phosphate isomerase/epimerase